MAGPRFVPLRFTRRPTPEVQARAEAFYQEADQRRSTRHFATTPVPRACLEWAIRTAGTAPSGAHRQPWHFVAISDPAIKAQLRAAAEVEEAANYAGRMPPAWREALAPLGTDAVKAHLTDAPWVVVMFKQVTQIDADGRTLKCYYADESCGIAAGMFITAIHHMGLSTLTHTPSPMAFLSSLLGRPANEKPFLVLPVGFPADDATVPDLGRRAASELITWREAT